MPEQRVIERLKVASHSRVPRPEVNVAGARIQCADNALLTVTKLLVPGHHLSNLDRLSH